MKERRNIVLYFFEEEGLGHVTHFRFIYQTLQDDYNILIFCLDNSSSDLLKGMNIYKLPNTGFTHQKDITERIHIIERKLKEFSPDIFLLDFFPFGKIQLRYELQTIIDSTQRNNGKIYTFIRDIFYGQSIFTPEEYHNFYSDFQTSTGVNIEKSLSQNHDDILIHLSQGLKNRAFRINLFLEYYLRQNIINGVLVFGDPIKYRFEDDFILGQDEKKKFHYFGYLAENIGTRIFSEKNHKKIVVSTGGNLTSEKQFLKLLVTLSHIPDITVDIYIGDFVRKEYRVFLEEYFAKVPFFHFTSFVPSFSEKLSQYDIYFGCGGYGVFLDIVGSAIPAYILPNYDEHIFYTRKFEQENRVKLFEDSMNIYILGKYSVQDIIKYIFGEYSQKEIQIQLVNPERFKDFFENK